MIGIKVWWVDRDLSIHYGHVSKIEDDYIEVPEVTLIGVIKVRIPRSEALPSHSAAIEEMHRRSAQRGNPPEASQTAGCA